MEKHGKARAFCILDTTGYKHVTHSEYEILIVLPRK